MSTLAGMDAVEAVLTLVETIPPGRVMTYGSVADYLGFSSARQVGQVMAVHGASVPWHRVVAANGRLVPGSEREHMARLMDEGVLLRTERVDIRRYIWHPEE